MENKKGREEIGQIFGELMAGVMPVVQEVKYKLLGVNIEKFLFSLQCPKCGNIDGSVIDWLLKEHSNGQPSFMCLGCRAVFPIQGLTFKEGYTNDQKVLTHP